jgi:DNA-directed RNA polymerase subunit H (RpoH/RPB5)
VVRIAKKSKSKKKTSSKKKTKKPAKKQAKPKPTKKKTKKAVKKQTKKTQKNQKKQVKKQKKSLKKDVKKASKDVKKKSKSVKAKVFKKSKNDDFKLETHFLVPKHTRLSEKEKKDLLEKYNISLEELPRISIKDPGIAHIKDLTTQDVIMIERPSETANTALFYRRVVK